MSLIAQDNIFNIYGHGSIFSDNNLMRTDALTRDDIADWLSPIDFNKEHALVLEKRTPGTCTWLTHTREFRDWFAGLGSRILWCPGKPGSGKTTMVSFVVDYLQKQQYTDSETVVLFILCRYNTFLSLNDLLASLIKQLILCCPTVDIGHLRESKLMRRSVPLDERMSFLRQVFSCLTSAYIVIDALDECFSDEVRHHLLEKLQLLTADCSAVKLMVTSRRLPTIQSAMVNATCLDIVANEEDIRTHIATKISANPALRALTSVDGSLRRILPSKIMEKADGMFLLVDLHINMLADQRSRRGLKSALERLPEGVIATYARAMLRIKESTPHDAEVAYHVLAWVTNAVRPLKSRELQWAVAIGMTKEEQAEEDDLLDEGFMISACAGLVNLDSSRRVRLIHYTAKEYLQGTQTPSELPKPIDLAISTLRFLTYKGLAWRADDLWEHSYNPNHEFLEYATTAWGRYAKQFESDSRVRSLVLQHLSSPAQTSLIGNADMLYQSRNVNSSGLQGSGALHLCAIFGLTEVAQSLASLQNNIEARDGYNMTPLMLAAWNGQIDVAKVLIGAGNVDIDATNNQGKTSLMLAALKGHAEVAKLLLDAGKANINARDKKDNTALLLAAWKGHEDTVALLLENGKPDINAKDNEGNTPLLLAAWMGHAGVVKTLLELGNPDINAGDNEGGTPLMWAAIKGNTEVVKLLLDTGKAGLDTIYQGKTPMMQASEKGHAEILEMLKSRGSNK